MDLLALLGREKAPRTAPLVSIIPHEANRPCQPPASPKRGAPAEPSGRRLVVHCRSGMVRDITMEGGW